jgi:geranylgeranyl diphosphate synthase, type I
MLDYLREQSKHIDSLMEEMIPRQIGADWVDHVLGASTYAVDLGTLTESLAVPIWDFLDRGGKRWRPVLLLAATAAVGGDESRARPLVPVIELIHNGTLVHDDLEDDSDIRRGKPCLHKLFGIDIATNVGSAMYFVPLVALYGAGSTYGDVERLRIYDMIVQELVRCHCGQAIDIAWHKGARHRITEAEYLQMCAYKTGVLARLAAKLGAYVGGGSALQIDGLGRFGETLGVAFQIQDDILNLIGEKFAAGKGRGEDIHEGKRTLLVWHALDNAPPADAARLDEILAAHPDDQATIDEAIAIIERTGALGYARERARALMEESWTELDALLSPSSAKDRLREFAEFVVRREV